jgi:anti-sigma factor RsiW
MKCRDVVELMTDYLDGALSPADRARFEDHISGCDGCRAYLEQLRATRSAAGRLASERVPESLQQELLNAFRDWRASSTKPQV